MPVLLKKRAETPEAGHEAPATKATAAKPSSSSASRSSSTIASREKTPSDNNAKVKRLEKTDDTPSTTTRSRSSTPATAKKEAAKPEAPEPAAATRRSVKTPPVPAKPVAVEKPKPAAPLPSQTLHKHKQAAVWTTGKKKHKTNFGAAYDSGSIPCRINHGSIKNALHWTKEPGAVDFSPLLVTCVEGFQETEHPFVFLARTMFRELMQVEDARDKTLVVLPQIVPPLRVALMSSDDDVFLMALEATRILSDTVEEEMNTYLPKLTQQIHRKLLTKQLRQPVEETLATLERNGGKEALAIIRSKIPTYVSLH